MESIGTGILLLGVVWIAGFGYLHARAAGKAKAAASWPSVTGRVIDSTVVQDESSDSDGESTTWYEPVVDYAYMVGEREHRGRRLRFGNYRSTSRQKAEAMLAPYPAGATPNVRYNPERPDESVLETSKPGPIYLVMAAFGLLFVAAGLFWNSLV